MKCGGSAFWGGAPALLAGCLLAEPAATDGERAAGAGAALPAREVTVFKDGHAFVLREGERDADADGRIVLDDLPEPVLGTFWPYAKDAKLVSATAARDRAGEERAAFDLVEMLRANVGQDVVLLDVDKQRLEGKLLGVSEMPLEEARPTDPGTPWTPAPRPDAVLRLAMAGGTRVMPVSRVLELETRGELGLHYTAPAWRERLTLRIDRALERVGVGVAYVQQGLRWIPAYRLDLGDDGTAAVRLEATLVNDLLDLEDATVNLVVGAPRFEFAGELDPIALREVAAAIGARAPARTGFASFSNALATQAAGYSAALSAPPEPTAPPAGQAEEDLYLYTVRGVTLKKGERLVLPLAEFTLPYRDVYVLEVPFAPPAEVLQQASGERALELARMLAAPKAMHTLRLTNTAEAPLTTAPALVLAHGRPLAQARMLYTASGARTDLPINAAVDVRVELEEHETGRKEEQWLSTTYERVALAGTLTLTNAKKEPVELEVRRDVLGLADAVGQGGAQIQRSLGEAWAERVRPEWWSWYSWPYWQFRLNGVARFTWSLKLEPGASAKLEASWHYLWR